VSLEPTQAVLGKRLSVVEFEKKKLRTQWFLWCFLLVFLVLVFSVMFRAIYGDWCKVAGMLQWPSEK
jgi:hypothetical protein